MYDTTPSSVDLLHLNGKDTFGDWQRYLGGRAWFIATGTFDSSTVTLEFSPDDGMTIIDAGAATTFTAPNAHQVDLPPLCLVRGKVAGGTAPSVNAKLISGALADAAGGALLSANNLSDVADVATARNNLGLGSAALVPTTAFDTAGAAAAAQAASEPKTLSVTTDATANHDLVLGDASKLILMTSGSANTVTVPLNATQAFPIGTKIYLAQMGAGTTTVAATGGVTIRSSRTLAARAQYSELMLTKIATDTWLLSLDTAP